MNTLKLVSLFLIVGSTALADDYFFLHSDASGDYYYVSSEPAAHRGRQLRVRNLTETAVTVTNTVYKPDWVVRAEGLYTNGLMQVGHAGAHTNATTAFEVVGIDLLERIVDSNNPNDAANTQKWKGVLESAYMNLAKYATAFGITDMKNFPYGSDVMTSSVAATKQVQFRGVTYTRREAE